MAAAVTSIAAETMTASSTSAGKAPRQRVPASERRDALIEAAVHEFAHGGLHGTPVDRIARRVGVAQPYVFSLFPNKRELFLAAVERGFEVVAETFTRAAAEYDPDLALPDTDIFTAMGNAYVQLLESDRDYLMLQHQSYAACGDEVIRDRVRACYARLVAHVERLSGAGSEPTGAGSEPTGAGSEPTGTGSEPTGAGSERTGAGSEPTGAGSERIDEFFRYGMWLNVAAAMGVEDLSAGCEWVRAEQA